MKCPVSMLPGASGSPAGVLFVIGAIAAIAYAMKAGSQQPQKSK